MLKVRFIIILACGHGAAKFYFANVKLFAYGQCGIRSNHNIATKHGINRQCK
jgi:molybdopterin/thiamine biosynthesis adenylyltransferase